MIFSKVQACQKSPERLRQKAQGHTVIINSRIGGNLHQLLKCEKSKNEVSYYIKNLEKRQKWNRRHPWEQHKVFREGRRDGSAGQDLAKHRDQVAEHSESWEERTCNHGGEGLTAAMTHRVRLQPHVAAHKNTLVRLGKGHLFGKTSHLSGTDSGCYKLLWLQNLNNFWIFMLFSGAFTAQQTITGHNTFLRQENVEKFLLQMLSCCALTSNYWCSLSSADLQRAVLVHVSYNQLFGFHTFNKILSTQWKQNWTHNIWISMTGVQTLPPCKYTFFNA